MFKLVKFFIVLFFWKVIIRVVSWIVALNSNDFVIFGLIVLFMIISLYCIIMLFREGGRF